MKMTRLLAALLCLVLSAGGAAAQIGGGGGISGPSPGNPGMSPAGRHTMNATPRRSIRDYHVTPASSAAAVYAAFMQADADLAALGGGVITVPNDGVYKSSARLAFSPLVGIEGAESIVPTVGGGNGPRIECQDVTSSCIVIGAADAAGQGGSLNNLIVSYDGTPAAGAHAVVIRGHNSQCQNIMVYNAYDAFTFQEGLSAHCSHLYTANISHMHIVQNGFPEPYISQSRFGMNGGGDVADSESFIGVTGNNPNGLVCDQCQFNLGSLSPHHLIEYYSLTNQIDGLVTLSNSVADMSIGNCQSLIKTDASATIVRLTISTTTLNGGSSCPFLDQSAQLAAPTGLKLLNNPFINVSDITIDTGSQGMSFDISNNTIIGNVALNSGSTISQGNFSGDKVLGNLTVTSTGGAWSGLTLDATRVNGTITDTAATGNIYYTGPAHSFTPVLSYGATAATATSANATEQRQPNGSVRYRFNYMVGNLNSGTGSVTLSGGHYACASSAFNSINQAPLGGSGMASLTGAPIITIAQAGSLISLLQSAATGYTALTNTNVPVSATIKGQIDCPLF